MEAKGWTLDTLRADILARLEALDVRLIERGHCNERLMEEFKSSSIARFLRAEQSIASGDQFMVERIAVLQKSMDDHINALRAGNELSHTEQQRAIDKSEKAQAAINIAQNEWRGTLNDITRGLIARPEFEQLSKTFEAYRLEVAKSLAAGSGEKEGSRERRDDGRANWAIGIAVTGLIVAIFAQFVARFV